MKRLAFAAAASALASAAVLTGAPAIADHHMEASAPAIEDVLANERRDGDRARDQFRNPAETLDFFGVEPDMTIAEFSPGGGWYTRVLAPYVIPTGKYVAFNTPARQQPEGPGWAETFTSKVSGAMGVDPAKINAFEVGDMPEDMAGTADRVLIFRSMHGLNAGNMADSVLKTARMLLKDDGMVGVVQHRAPDGASYDDYGARQRGYMREADVVNIFEANGFELVETSEINANPKDPANWPRGVWTLPPTLATGKDDPKRSEYLEIGESDRMTLLFKKAY